MIYTEVIRSPDASAVEVILPSVVILETVLAPRVRVVRLGPASRSFLSGAASNSSEDGIQCEGHDVY